MISTEELEREYTALMCEIQTRRTLGNYHVGDAENWCLSGQEVYDAMASLAGKRNEAEKKGVPFY